jgi:hypothetical protein
MIVPLAFEILQWALLLFLTVMVFGLTRQLGFFLAPRHDQLMQQAPQEGDQIGEATLDLEDRAAIRHALSAAHSGSAVVVVIDENCLGCRQLLEALKPLMTRRRSMPLVAVVRRSSAGFVEEARMGFDVVIDDSAGEKSQRAGVLGTPFAMTIDRDFRVEHVELGGLTHERVFSWFETVGETAEGPVEPALTKHNASMEMTR